MKLNPFELGLQGFQFWRRNRVGNKIGRKLFPKITARREAKRAANKSGQAIPAEPVEQVKMDSIKGALMSKLVWLGIVQIGYGLFEAWSSGTLNAESVSTAISGVLTIVFRAVTTNSLADKAKPAA